MANLGRLFQKADIPQAQKIFPKKCRKTKEMQKGVSNYTSP
jgi:hypothetical protein